MAPRPNPYSYRKQRRLMLFLHTWMHKTKPIRPLFSTLTKPEPRHWCILACLTMQGGGLCLLLCIQLHTDSRLSQRSASIHRRPVRPMARDLDLHNSSGGQPLWTVMNLHPAPAAGRFPDLQIHTHNRLPNPEPDQWLPGACPHTLQSTGICTPCLQ